MLHTGSMHAMAVWGTPLHVLTQGGVCLPPHSCLTMFPEHYFLVHPSVFPQASECHPSGSCDASCNARANTLLQQCCALPSPKNQGGGYVVP